MENKATLLSCSIKASSATATATMKFWTNGRAASLNSFYHGRIPFHKTLNEWCLVPPTYWNLW
jgi:hypothetical protein